MNLLAQLQAANVHTKPKRTQSVNGAETRARQHRARYEKIFSGRRLTTVQVAAGAGITCMGCLNVLRKFKQRGLVREVGRRPTGGTNPVIVWEWVDQ